MSDIDIENPYELVCREIVRYSAELFKPLLQHGETCNGVTTSIYACDMDEIYMRDSFPGLGAVYKDAHNGAQSASYALATSLADNIRLHTERPEVHLQTTGHLRNVILGDGLYGIIGHIEKSTAEVGDIAKQIESESVIGSMLVGGAAGKVAHWAMGGKRSGGAQPMVIGAIAGGLLSSSRKSKLGNAAAAMLIQGLLNLVREAERVPARLIDQYATLVSTRVDLLVRDAAAEKALAAIADMASAAKAIIHNLSSLYIFLASSAEQRKRCSFYHETWRFRVIRFMVSICIMIDELVPHGAGRAHVATREDGLRSESLYPLAKSVSSLKMAIDAAGN